MRTSFTHLNLSLLMMRIIKTEKKLNDKNLNILKLLQHKKTVFYDKLQDPKRV